MDSSSAFYVPLLWKMFWRSFLGWSRGIKRSQGLTLKGVMQANPSTFFQLISLNLSAAAHGKFCRSAGRSVAAADGGQTGEEAASGALRGDAERGGLLRQGMLFTACW